MASPFAALSEIASKPSRTVVGLISGTSADSIDVAVCRFLGDGPRVELLAYEEHSYDPEVRARIVDPAALDVRAVAELNVRVGEEFARACLTTLDASGMRPGMVDLIGSHGQTIYHHSGVAGSIRATLQVGDGDVIAARTGRFVISDFRAADVAAGGEGAPLSPIADAILFRHEGERRRVVLNLGGIANVTVLDPDPAKVYGFDTGPANSAIDRLARILTNGAERCDRDGRLAFAGKVDQRLLARLIGDDPFLGREPPKSTGFEAYGDAFLAHAADLHGGCDADLMTTLTEFSAQAIGKAFRDFVTSRSAVDEIVVAGGGVKNPALMARIVAAVAPTRVVRSDELGVPSDARESMIFALLADMTLRGVPAHLPPVTGATAPKLLGKLSFP